jgi:hypothetical protein
MHGPSWSIQPAPAFIRIWLHYLCSFSQESILPMAPIQVTILPIVWSLVDLFHLSSCRSFFYNCRDWMSVPGMGSLDRQGLGHSARRGSAWLMLMRLTGGRAHRLGLRRSCCWDKALLGVLCSGGKCVEMGFLAREISLFKCEMCGGMRMRSRWYCLL